MLVKAFLKHRWLVRIVPVAFLGVFVVTFTLFYVHFLPRRGSFSYESLSLCEAGVEPIETSGNFSVLLWTSYFGLRDNANFDSSEPANCAYRNCDFTTDREAAPDADAVVFHEADMSLDDLPDTRAPSQRWVMFNQEAPPNSRNLRSAFDGLFNWTMTYHHLDDVQVPYFEMCRTNSTDAQRFEQPEEKAWAAVWFVSDCSTSSHRMAYVEELQNYLTVDIIGACSPHNLQCPKKNHRKCLDMFLPRYKFVLAFENSICSDYVTEKFKNVLPYDIIPILWGGVDYGKFLPRESFVVASDYPSPKELARALYRFRDNSLFRRTVSHRNGIRAKTVEWKCKLCEKLNRSRGQSSSRKDLFSKFHKNGRCKVWRKGHFQEFFPQ